MLKPAGQPEHERHRRPWWLLLFVPPVALLAWFFVGMDVRFDPWTVQTKWIRQLSPPLTSPMLNQPVPDTHTARSNFFPLGDHIFVVGYSWPPH